MASLNNKPSDNCFGLSLSSIHWLLVGDELCSKGPQVLLKHLKVCSDELAVTEAATVEGDKLGLGSPKLEEDKEKFVFSCAPSFKGTICSMVL